MESLDLKKQAWVGFNNETTEWELFWFWLDQQRQIWLCLEKKILDGAWKNKLPFWPLCEAQVAFFSDILNEPLSFGVIILLYYKIQN